jgi:hypothetical protein
MKKGDKETGKKDTKPVGQQRTMKNNLINYPDDIGASSH